MLKYIIHISLLLSNLVGLALGDMPSLSEISKIVGYPADMLEVNDVTSSERKIYSLQTTVERQRGTVAPINPDSILFAYRITSKIPDSFYPILVTITSAGTLISPEGGFVEPRIELFIKGMSKIPEGPLDEGGRGHFGLLDVPGFGHGGIAFGRVRTPSRIMAMESPGYSMGTIGFFTVPEVKLDIRVAIMSVLDNRVQILAPMKNAELYFSYFREPGGAFDEPLPGGPKFQWVEGLAALGKIAVDSYVSDGRSGHGEGRSEPLESRDIEHSDEIVTSEKWGFWLLVGAVIVGAVIVVWRKFKVSQ